jgi:NAD(P)-dependent dehydrogenase (short-subunit alcohol dehydrogenase family)
MTDSNPTTTRAIVTGASRGFGRGTAAALVAAGIHVIGVARTAGTLAAAAEEDSFAAVQGDAADPEVAAKLIAEYEPHLVVLNAGVTPRMGLLDEQTWETFRQNWEVDTRQAFEWNRAALRAPLRPGSLVVSVSSGAAINGSPLSGGYASAKSAIRFIGSYAADVSARRSLGLRFITLLPQLSPATELGTAGIAAYAKLQGIETSTFVSNLQPILTPDHVGTAIVGLYRSTEAVPHAEYLISGRGLRPIGEEATAR